MDASIPGKYGFRRRSEQRQVALDLVWRSTEQLIEAEARRSNVPTPCNICWSELPAGLDPAEGELDDGRAARKRAQVESLAAHALDMMGPSAHVVEFGAGSGHLGILLAHLRPDANVVLVECKDYSVPVARERVESLGLANCRVFHGTVDAFAGTEEPFDLAVGLHTCGLLADAILALAIKRRAAACIVPCCYGQVATLKEDHHRGEGTSMRMHPCSTALSSALGQEGAGAFAWCAKSADFTAGRGGEFDAQSEGFCTALRCMRTVDTDRLWWARERGYDGSLGLLDPLGCSPKCSVVRIVPSASAASISQSTAVD